MNATFLKRWTTWLLPLLVLRAFIPVGFMLGSGPQGLHLMFCPGVLQVADSHPAASNDGHSGTNAGVGSHAGSHDESQHSHSHEQQEHAPCPYGLVGAAACGATISIAGSCVVTDESIALPSTPLPDRSPIRAEPIRGPPFSSLKALI